MIDSCVKELKNGKACGPDDLCNEHLVYARPSLIMHLESLFSLMAILTYVRNSFGMGTSVLFFNDKSGNINDVEIIVQLSYRL
jgi:hypothetical protein